MAGVRRLRRRNSGDEGEDGGGEKELLELHFVSKEEEGSHGRR